MGWNVLWELRVLAGRFRLVCCGLGVFLYGFFLSTGFGIWVFGCDFIVLSFLFLEMEIFRLYFIEGKNIFSLICRLVFLIYRYLVVFFLVFVCWGFLFLRWFFGIEFKLILLVFFFIWFIFVYGRYFYIFCFEKFE